MAIAIKGVTWKASCLGECAKENGVYIIHHGGSIVYVGKTGSPTMSYGDRLRREFQEGASSGRHIFPKLAALSTSKAKHSRVYTSTMLSTRMARPQSTASCTKSSAHSWLAAVQARTRPFVS